MLMLRKYGLWLLIPLVAFAVPAQGAARKLLLQIESPPLAWGQCMLENKINTALSRNPDLRVHSTSAMSDQPAFPEDHYNLDSLVDWGREMGGRYLLLVAINDERLERRKSFSIPLFVHKYETVGVIRGEMRLLDLQKNRLLAAEPFVTELGGPRQFQGPCDENRNDPGLHITASDKSVFFERLEDKLADHLVTRITKLTGGR